MLWQMTLGPVLRLVSLVYLRIWDGQIRGYQKKQKALKDKNQ